MTAPVLDLKIILLIDKTLFTNTSFGLPINRQRKAITTNNDSKMSSSLRSLQTLLRAPVRSSAAAAAHQALPRTTSISAYHTSRRLQFPYKDDQDRESLKPRSNEGSKSSSDDAAAQTDTAFDPSTTRPEDEKTKARKETGGGETSPLESSGANHEVSQPKQEEMQGTTRSERNKSSGGGSPEKKGKGPAA